MPKANIIGREEEIELFDAVIKSKEAEFVAVYGRRRVGKTFLVREYFSNASVYFETTGVKHATLPEQMEHFIRDFSETFYKGVTLKRPTSWNEAFDLLDDRIKKMSKNKKIVVFLDALPWMASKRSRLLQALDYYWNRYWSSQPNLILIVCGSAASWMLSHLIHAKGGLYNRLTKRILLEPFNLLETEKFLKKRSIKLNKKGILDLYLTIGGIPFYLKEIKAGKSASQIIDDVCFKKKGLLYSEFDHLFKSLFDQSEINLNIIKEIVKSNNSISREQLMKNLGLSSGGQINRRIEELESSGFIQCFIPYGKKRRDRFYRIIDEYTLFYFKWIKPFKSGTHSGKDAYWQRMVKRGSVNAWAGLAFESICFKHIDQINKALGLDQIPSIRGSWRYTPSKGSKKVGAQIDLLFDRDDGAITLCEIKYVDHFFEIDKSYAKNLEQKIETFEENFPSKWHPTKKQIFLAMITTFGLKKNMYSETLIQNEVVLDDLFR